MAVWALRLTDMRKDFVTLLSLNLLLCLHLLYISEQLLMSVRKSAFKIPDFSSKHRCLEENLCLKPVFRREIGNFESGFTHRH